MTPGSNNVGDDPLDCHRGFSISSCSAFLVKLRTDYRGISSLGNFSPAMVLLVPCIIQAPNTNFNTNYENKDSREADMRVKKVKKNLHIY